MGVRGLWEVVGPVAKPIQLESLRRQRLAVDASIWIYQFLKAVRDSQGNAVKYAHIVGFFRRICKLLFFGIRPVFVFDGIAPALKRETVNRRRERRQGHEESTKRTAARLLTLQMQRLAAESTSSKKRKRDGGGDDEEQYVYYDERNINAEDRHDAKKGKQKAFKPQDQYHLPEVDDFSKVVDVNDPRMMTDEELREYADEFQHQLNTGLYDTMEVDFESADFKALPLATQYQLVNTARLRSRLRMGYTADQLDERFQDRMEFSKFQINRVAQRNYLTQKIMNIVGMDDESSGQRIAGQKGSEYILNKNETGWTLALQNENKQRPVVELDSDGEEKDEEQEREEEDDEDDEEWESVDLGAEQSQVQVQVQAQSQVQAQALETEQSPFEGLPAELSGFETQVQRQHLYEKLQEQAVLEEQLKLKHKAKIASSETSETGVRQPGYMPFLLKGDLDANQFKPKPDFSPAKKDKNTKPITFEGGSSLFGSKVESFDSETADKAEDKEESDGGAGAGAVAAAAPLPPWFNRNRRGSGTGSETLEVQQDKDAKRKLQRELNEEQGIEDGGGDDESDEDRALESSHPKELVESPVEVVEPDQLEEPPVEVIQLDEPDEADEPGEPGEPSVSEHEQYEVQEAHEVQKVQEQSKADEELAQQEAQYDQDEDEQLLDQMMGELEEHERFTKQLNNNKAATIEDYSGEIERLKRVQQNEQRDADHVSSTMVEECQALLQLFGIPYITAPTEAEAQCAKLVELGLVDGVVTDDSDCFLFGGNKIYKNMFNQAKYVERYDSEDVEREFGLDRYKLIQLAELLGSDYTDGIAGIGPVQGLELLGEFGTLQKFVEWWEKEQHQTKPSPELSEFCRKFRQRHLTKVFLPEHFPNPKVEEAYLRPQVDEDPTKFEWGTPDLDKIRTFLTNCTGWSQVRVDEMLVPVIRELNKPPSTSSVQQTLTDYVGVSPLKRMEIGHKRMHKAVQKLRGAQ